MNAPPAPLKTGTPAPANAPERHIVVSTDKAAAFLAKSGGIAVSGNLPTGSRKMSPFGLPFAKGAKERELTTVGGKKYTRRPDIRDVQFDQEDISKRVDFCWFTIEDVESPKGEEGAFVIVQNVPGNYGASFIDDSYFDSEGYIRRGRQYLWFGAWKPVNDIRQESLSGTRNKLIKLMPGSLKDDSGNPLPGDQNLVIKESVGVQ